MQGIAMPKWLYKFVISERFKTGLWYAIEEDERKIEPILMQEHLNRPQETLARRSGRYRYFCPKTIWL